MARAKNTARAEARRRHRAIQQRSPDQANAVDEGSPASETDTAESRPQRPSFGFPNVREDLKALPGVLTARRSMAIPVVLMIAGLLVGLGVTAPIGFDPTLNPVAQLFFQLTLLPPSLPVLMAGFIARRASYLVGLLFGAFEGVLLFVLIAAAGSSGSATIGSVEDPANVGVFNLVYSALTGMLYGGLAGWYRRFLDQMKERQRATRAARIAAREAKAREERREARRQARQLPR